MKKIVLSLVLLVSCVWTLGAQAQIYTKKMKVADFTEKTLKVVLSGSDLTDGPFKAEVIKQWKLSPYEFCTIEEFNALKTDPNYYFMFIVGKNDELDHLEVVKGTPNPGENLEKMLSVVSLPIRPTGNMSIRYLVYLGAYLNFFQTFIADAMVNDVIGYSGLSRKALNARATKDSDFLLADTDLAQQKLDEKLREKMKKARIQVVSEEVAVDAMLEAKPHTLVSYCIRPINTPKHKYYYTLLVGADDHKLYYCRKHYYTKDADAGFTAFAIDILAGKIMK